MGWCTANVPRQAGGKPEGVFIAARVLHTVKAVAIGTICHPLKGVNTIDMLERQTHGGVAFHDPIGS